MRTTASRSSSGRKPANHRLVLDGIFWIARTGSPGRDFPEEFGKWSSVYRQFRRWTLAGLWKKIMDALNESGAVPHALQLIDSTVVRAHHQAAGAKGGLHDRVSTVREVASRRLCCMDRLISGIEPSDPGKVRRMPFMFNADRRHKFEKPGYRVTNWREYNEALRRRGDLTVWFDTDAVQPWSAPRRKTRGGQPRYSELAIDICLTLRQTQGLVRSIARLCELLIEVPCLSTLSRRSAGLKLRPIAPPRPGAQVHLVGDSIGLKIFGAGEWQEQKHGTPVKRRSWRKLHIGLDLISGDILCTELTTDDVGDPTALPAFLDRYDAPLDRFLADGAFDGSPTYDLLAERFGAAVEVAIAPPKNAVASADAARNPMLRDRHIAAIWAHGRMAWQRSTGYNRRARVETQMGRWKTVIGPSLRARNFENQKTEAAVAARVLNRMTALGRPQYERIA